MKLKATHYSDKAWCLENYELIQAWLDADFDQLDHPYLWEYISKNPRTGRLLYKNFVMPERKKKLSLLNTIKNAKHCVIGIIGRQRTGKDVLACAKLGAIKKSQNCRVVVLGAFANYPEWLVDKKDYYWSFYDVPSGSPQCPVYCYIPELALFINARDIQSPENKKFGRAVITSGQNYIKIIGCAQMASLVDINFWRSCTILLFKHMNPRTLDLERENFIDELTEFLIPQCPFDDFGNVDKDIVGDSLVVADGFIYNFNVGLPSWWNEQISEQYRNVSKDKLLPYIEYLFNQEHTPREAMKLINGKFSNVNFPIAYYEDLYKSLGFNVKSNTKQSF